MGLRISTICLPDYHVREFTNWTPSRQSSHRHICSRGGGRKYSGKDYKDTAPPPPPPHIRYKKKVVSCIRPTLLHQSSVYPHYESSTSRNVLAYNWHTAEIGRFLRSVMNILSQHSRSANMHIFFLMPNDFCWCVWVFTSQNHYLLDSNVYHIIIIIFSCIFLRSAKPRLLKIHQIIFCLLWCHKRQK